MPVCLYGCFCCKYSKDNSNNNVRDCSICPIDLGTKSYGCQCSKPNTAYTNWCEMDYDYEWKLAAKYAREIANLPARKL